MCHKFTKNSQITKINKNLHQFSKFQSNKILSQFSSNNGNNNGQENKEDIDKLNLEFPDMQNLKNQILNPENQRPAQQKQQQQIKLNKDELISEEDNEVDQESDEFLNSEEEEIQEEALDSDSLSIMNQNIKMQKKKGFQDIQTDINVYGSGSTRNNQKFNFQNNKKVNEQVNQYSKQQQQQQNLEIDEEEDEDKKKKPAWMKFFQSSEPMKVDIERSVKSENTDLIHNYIRSSYMSFTYEQLIISLQKLYRTSILPKIIFEIKQRIIFDNYVDNYELDLKLLKYSFETVIEDSFFQQYLTVKFTQNFDKYNMEQKTDIIKYLLIINRINEKLVHQFLSFYQQKDFKEQQYTSLEEYLKSLGPEILSYQINVLIFLSKYVKKEVFCSYVTKDVVDIFFQLFVDNINKNFQVYDNIDNLEMEKIIPLEMPYFYNHQQIQQIKKLIAEKMIMKFNNYETKGIFLNFKKDKSVSKIIRNIFEQTDRFILQDLFLLYGNYLLVREKNDFKFDFKLFSFLQRYNLIHKLYLDEALWPIKNLTKSLMNSLKKQNLLDHALSFIVFHKVKIYLELNYEDLSQQEDLDYRKNLWNRIIKDSIYCMEEYLQQIQNSNLLYKVLNLQEMQPGLEKPQDSRPEKYGDYYINSKEENDNQFQHNGNNNSKNVKNDNDDEDNESEFSQYVKQSNLGNSKEEEGMLKNYKQHKENYEKNKQIKLDAYEKIIQEQEFKELNIYEQKINIFSTIPLKYYINLMETITNIIYNYKYLSPTFFDILAQFLQYPKHQDIFKHFAMTPKYLDSLIMLITYQNSNIQYNWFEKEFQQEIMNVKQEIDDLFLQSQGDSNKLLEILGDYTDNKTDLSDFQRDKAYDFELFYKEIQNHSYLFDEPIQETNVENNSDVIKTIRKKCYMNQRFIVSKENIVQKILNSEVLKQIMNTSQLKTVVDYNLPLCKISNKIIKNYVSFPFAADFLLEDRKVVIQILDYRKVLGGAEGIITGYYKKSEEYFKLKGYQVCYIKYSDFQLKDQDLQQKIIQIVNNTEQ